LNLNDERLSKEESRPDCQHQTAANEHEYRVLLEGERQMTVWISTHGENQTSAREDAEKARASISKRPETTSVVERADDEMGRWRKTLSPNQRARLEVQASPWARNGGSIVTPKRRRTRTARKNEKLRREREARFQTEQADYEARLAASWKIEKSPAA
jgi:hypothetical protein